MSVTEITGDVVQVNQKNGNLVFCMLCCTWPAIMLCRFCPGLFRQAVGQADVNLVLNYARYQSVRIMRGAPRVGLVRGVICNKPRAGAIVTSCMLTKCARFCVRRNIIQENGALPWLFIFNLFIRFFSTKT